MRRDTTKRQVGLKPKYRLKNWTQYNAGLIARGDVTMWIDQNMCVPPTAQAPMRGHPVVYADALIQGLLGLKHVFHLRLRALQGFAGSLRKLAFRRYRTTNVPGARGPDFFPFIGSRRQVE
jgi:hypothetical protein